MARSWIFALVVALAGCASSPPNGIDEVWDDPLAADGRNYTVTAYPFDLLGDPERYVLCFEPCSRERAVDRPSVLIPKTPGRFDSMAGATAVELNVVFRAGCFRPRSLCVAHRPYVFEEQ